MDGIPKYDEDLAEENIATVRAKLSMLTPRDRKRALEDYCLWCLKQVGDRQCHCMNDE